MDIFFKNFFKSLSTKIILVTALLIILILGVQTTIYVQVETNNLENTLINNKKDFTELLAINFGAAQSVGGFAFQSQLIEDAGKTKDTVFVRFVNPNGEIYLSSIDSEAGKIIQNPYAGITQTVVADTVYNGQMIKLVVAPGPGGYMTWLGFSLNSTRATVDSTIFSRVLLSLIILLVGVAFAFVSFLRLTKDLKLLRNLAEEVRRGNLKAKTNIKSGDEIGDLAKSFNQMTENLLKSRQGMEEKVKELSAEHGKLSSLVESVRLGVVMVDLSLNVILANSAAKKVLGKSPDKAITFSDLSEKLKGSVNISQALSFYVKSGKPLNVQEVTIDDRYFRLFMSPVRDIVDKIFIGAVVVIEDITDEKMLDKMRTEIVSITSHQLRTPLTIIKGNLEMVLGGDVGPISEPQKDLLSDSYKGNERMIKLINDLMDAAKIDEGKFALTPEPAQLEDVVKEIIAEIGKLAVNKKVELSYNYPDKPLPSVKINKMKVKQVLQNLIVNAVMYSSVDDKGKVAVAIKEEGGFLQFEVKDNGVGIPAAEQGKLFERFFRGSNVSKLDPGGGTGLGLYIAKAIIEQSGGKIWFDSKENEGTTFFATFPY
jgi:signal transduction histidine kinase